VTALVRRSVLAATIAVVTACAAASQPAAPVQTATQAQTTTPPATATATQTTTPPVQTVAPSPSGTTTVEIGDNFYLPQLVVVAVGTRVLFVNRGQMTHTASARDESFNSGNLEFGQSYERVFAVVGRFTFYCVQHEDMNGIIEVR